MRFFFFIALWFVSLAHANKVDISSYEALNDYVKTLNVIAKNSPYSHTKEQLIKLSLETVLAKIDPHAKLISQQGTQTLKDHLKGNFQGIGIVFTQTQNGFLIQAVFKGSPAEKDGLKVGDIILSINNQATDTLSFDDFQQLLRDDDQEKISLTIKRNKAQLTKTLTRAKIALNEITWHINKPIAFIKIPSFIGRKTITQLKKILFNLKKDPSVKGLIIDLRGNTGGLFKAGIEFCNFFINNQLITSVQGKTPSDHKGYYAGSGVLFENTPLVLLVDDQTASAAEIVVGCLQDHNKALILGTKTHGKASVQTIFPLDSNFSLQLTTHFYKTPNGTNIDQQGIAPDIIISHTKEKAPDGEAHDALYQKAFILLNDLLKNDKTIQAYKKDL